MSLLHPSAFVMPYCTFARKCFFLRSNLLCHPNSSHDFIKENNHRY